VFGVDSAELIIVGLAALIFIGPKELPGALRTLGGWVSNVRAHARHFTGGIEDIMSEAELAEIEAKWRGAIPRAVADVKPAPTRSATAATAGIERPIP